MQYIFLFCILCTGKKPDAVSWLLYYILPVIKLNLQGFPIHPDTINILVFCSLILTGSAGFPGFPGIGNILSVRDSLWDQLHLTELFPAHQV